MPSFKENVKFAPGRLYSSETNHKPVDFYRSAFENSVQIEFLLGYYNSAVFEVLGESFLQFVKGGGTMKLAINHFLSEIDKEIIYGSDYTIDQEHIKRIIENFEDFLISLTEKGKFFLDCIRYLIEQERIIIIPIALSKMATAHYKSAIFYSSEDTLYVNGSANFTRNGLIGNGENIAVDVSWESTGQERIAIESKRFESIFSKKNKSFIYLDAEDVFVGPLNKHTEKQSLDRLTEKYKKLNSKTENQENIMSEPALTFEPRDYQRAAYSKWIENNCIGLFSMATGTGKTKTALYSVKEQAVIDNFYNIIIGVPSNLLLEQWEEECIDFGFTNIITSKTTGYKKKLKDLDFNQSLGLRQDFIFICTYAMIAKGVIQEVLDLSKIDVTFIGDEAHNIGADSIRKNIPTIFKKKLGLSATPNRKYDTIGSEFINNFFRCHEDGYTYNFSLFKAIQQGHLAPYSYHAHFVNLNESELDSYIALSKKLLKFFDFESGEFREGAEMLLIQRKRIIHKAADKLDCFKKILTSITNEGRPLNQTIVYVPEGEDIESQSLINQYSSIISESGLKTHQITSSSENIKLALDNFENGSIDVLTAMKMLDEGIDIPSIKRAVFCSSTGNPKQFIQRRGRILRKHPTKEFAEIHDMVVAPSDISKRLFLEESLRIKSMEDKIFRNELDRIVDFAYASKNLSELTNATTKTARQLIVFCEEAGIDLFKEINKKLNNEDNN